LLDELRATVHRKADRHGEVGLVVQQGIEGGEIGVEAHHDADAPDRRRLAALETHAGDAGGQGLGSQVVGAVDVQPIGGAGRGVRTPLAQDVRVEAEGRPGIEEARAAHSALDLARPFGHGDVSPDRFDHPVAHEHDRVCEGLAGAHDHARGADHQDICVIVPRPGHPGRSACLWAHRGGSGQAGPQGGAPHQEPADDCLHALPFARFSRSFGWATPGWTAAGQDSPGQQPGLVKDRAPRAAGPRGGRNDK